MREASRHCHCQEEEEEEEKSPLAGNCGRKEERWELWLQSWCAAGEQAEMQGWQALQRAWLQLRGKKETGVLSAQQVMGWRRARPLRVGPGVLFTSFA